MKVCLILLIAGFGVNVLSATIVSENWNNVNGDLTYILEHPDTSTTLFKHITNLPGASQKVDIKMEPGYVNGDISDQTALGSDGMAFVKRDSLHKGGLHGT